MAGFLIYGAAFFHPAFQKLDDAHKMAFIELGVAMRDANNLHVPEGFTPDISLENLPIPFTEMQQRLQHIQEKTGMVRRIDDPEGWVIERWNDYPVRYRAGVPGHEIPRWGQDPLRHLATALEFKEQGFTDEQVKQMRAHESQKAKERKAKSKGYATDAPAHDELLVPDGGHGDGAVGDLPQSDAGTLNTANADQEELPFEQEDQP